MTDSTMQRTAQSRLMKSVEWFAFGLFSACLLLSIYAAVDLGSRRVDGLVSLLLTIAMISIALFTAWRIVSSRPVTSQSMAQIYRPVGAYLGRASVLTVTVLAICFVVSLALFVLGSIYGPAHITPQFLRGQYVLVNSTGAAQTVSREEFDLYQTAHNVWVLAGLAMALATGLLVLARSARFQFIHETSMTDW
jgi:hypothetical protein